MKRVNGSYNQLNYKTGSVKGVGAMPWENVHEHFKHFEKLPPTNNSPKHTNSSLLVYFVLFIIKPVRELLNKS